MNYIKVTPFLNYSSKETAKLISRELFKISKPTIGAEDSTFYLFEVLENVNNGECYLCVNVNEEINVHKDKNLDNLILMMNHLYNPSEISSIVKNLNTKSKVLFKELLSPSLTLYTYKEMVSNGSI